MFTKNKNEAGNGILGYILVFLGVLTIGLVARTGTFVFFMLVAVALFICSIFYLISHLQKKKAHLHFASTLGGTIYENILLCEKQIARNEKESDEIEQNILEIKQKINSNITIHESTLKDSEILIKGFERELELRLAKLEFYKTCKNKLHNIRYNKELADDLKRKKDKLQELQEDHFEDLAEMERLRSDMEYDRTYIDTINKLSMRMAESTTLDSANELYRELKLITKELRDL